MLIDVREFFASVRTTVGEPGVMLARVGGTPGVSRRLFARVGTIQIDCRRLIWGGLGLFGGLSGLTRERRGRRRV